MKDGDMNVLERWVDDYRCLIEEDKIKAYTSAATFMTIFLSEQPTEDRIDIVNRALQICDIKDGSKTEEEVHDKLINLRKELSELD